MTSEIIGIENDQSQQVIDAAAKALSQKGVILHDQDETMDSISLTFQGLGNKRKATHALPFPSLKDLSNKQIQEKASEIVREVEQKLRSGGDEV